MRTLAERIAADGITAESTYNPAGVPEGWDRDADAWLVTLHNPATGQTMTVPFQSGPGLKADVAAGVPARWVLDSLTSDASGYLNADGFEDWAGEYGYDTDSRAAEKVYNRIGEQVETLRAFLGDSFDAYLWETESL